jgi:hypothetical protein
MKIPLPGIFSWPAIILRFMVMRWLPSPFELNPHVRGLDSERQRSSRTQRMWRENRAEQMPFSESATIVNLGCSRVADCSGRTRRLHAIVLSGERLC